MKAMTITGQGYMNAAESLDFKPYPITATITGESRDSVSATINGFSYWVRNVQARADRDDTSKVTVHIDTGTHEALITLPKDEWTAAASAFNS